MGVPLEGGEKRSIVLSDPVQNPISEIHTASDMRLVLADLIIFFLSGVLQG